MVGRVIEDAVGERTAAAVGAADGAAWVVGGAGVFSLPQAASTKTSGIKNNINLLNFKPVTSSFITFITGLMRGSCAPETNFNQPHYSLLPRLKQSGQK
jgi:hypothetical protein